MKASEGFRTRVELGQSVCNLLIANQLCVLWLSARRSSRFARIGLRRN